MLYTNAMFLSVSYAACLKSYTLQLRTEIQVNGQRQPITKPLNSSCQTSFHMYIAVILKKRVIIKTKAIWASVYDFLLKSPNYRAFISGWRKSCGRPCAMASWLYILLSNLSSFICGDACRRRLEVKVDRRGNRKINRVLSRDYNL